ncbi:sigma 54-interacting transcriptional regulator [Cupriavidus respiraculi]|uniref:sigma-54-dependent transcriptional regulator n=1 Tax=Cupriavidus respiraculi TaxID=195930 RepID=UPI001C98C66A|nr:sigma 54-interacting transcriptional regulator [Cupriavidus respiraculi]MBY4949716.1 sigma 54-interacting transcriptional regulator [Cupriavidus respiraculi]
MHVSVDFVPPVDDRQKPRILAALADAGIAPQPSRVLQSCTPRLLFFSEITEALLALTQEARGTAMERVLAIDISPNGWHADPWQLLKAGASELLCWHRSGAPAMDIAARLQRWEAVDRLMEQASVRDGLIGQGPRWRKILRQTVELAHFTHADLLVLGESGTGKELVARLVHALDARPGKGSLVTLDCTTIVPELSGSEFFGHERGAFTGAVQAREGAFAMAHNGTLFLDEVGELPLPLQGQLLRVVQEHVYKCVGGNTWHETDFRLVCATHRDLSEAVRRGEFRHDLYYRIASWTLHLPPLRERTQDIVEMARHFAAHFARNARPDGCAPEFDEAVSQYLSRREYPGNVRELRQLVSRIMDRHLGAGPITAADVPEDDRPAAATPSQPWLDASFEQAIQRALSMGLGLKEIGRAAEQIAVDIAVHEANGSLRRAADRLGVTDRALQMRRAGTVREARAPKPH